MNDKEQWLINEIEACGTVRLSVIYDHSPWGYHATREAIRTLLERDEIHRCGQGLSSLERSTAKVDEGRRQKQDHSMPLTSKTENQVLTPSEPLTTQVDTTPRFGSGATRPTPDERDRALTWIRAIRQGIDIDDA